MDNPECDNCGRELDEWDAGEGVCSCGAPIPPEIVKQLTTPPEARTTTERG